jgi:hypothetical protein
MDTHHNNPCCDFYLREKDWKGIATGIDTQSKIDEDSDQEIYEEPSYAIPIPYLLLIGLGLIFASLSLNSGM